MNTATRHPRRSSLSKTRSCAALILALGTCAALSPAWAQGSRPSPEIQDFAPQVEFTPPTSEPSTLLEMPATQSLKPQTLQMTSTACGGPAVVKAVSADDPCASPHARIPKVWSTTGAPASGNR